MPTRITIKKEMAKHLETRDKRVLNGLGPFASLYDISFPEIKNPVLVLKSEEPGSKQKLAMEYGYTDSICHDMINHLVNDIAVMGAKPLAVLDTIVCGNAEKDTISALVKGVSDAAGRMNAPWWEGRQACSRQWWKRGCMCLPPVLPGSWRETGSLTLCIEEGDIVLALASNGLHTNGYSLVRMLMDRMPEIKLEKVDGMTFTEQIMKPHTPYYKA